MSNSKAFQLPLISLLLFTSVFTHNSSVFASNFVRNQTFTRPDPLRHFRLYKGGYDIRDKHYWASTAFTGIHGYAMAGIWMLFGLTFGSYLIVKTFNGGFHPFINHPSSYYLASFALIVIFTSIAIIFSSLILVANQSSLHRSKNLMDTILGGGTSMKQTIEAVMNGLIKIQTLLQPYDGEAYDLLNHITNQMRKETISIQNFVKEARNASNHAMKAVYIANLVFVTVNLVVLVGGCVVLFLHWHPGFIILIIVCWILTTVSWILTGFDFFFHIFAGDTCSAFEKFEQNQNPESNSIMSILSSCSNTSNSEKFMAQIGYTVHKYIAESNSEITTLAHKMVQPNEESDDSFVIERICDPFSTSPNYNYAPSDCPQDSIQIHDLPNILSTLTCEKHTPTDICKAQGRFFPESSYGKTMAYIQSIENLIATYPDLQSLAGCTPVKHAISDVALHQCEPFKTSVRFLWACIFTVSIDMMMLTSLLIVKACQDKGKYFSWCSIVPMRHPC
ncbi:hypothetical protein L2E82_18813 [Cichorium intybus]|uniref:Uncharacterized protein n=1 Tax=Cichorium intybus TaxID=13427 RepID=A0ACB9FBR5_CICIN|nr:hypothetical protein L2E82_18813 [Cichorium intybus]